MAALPFEGFFEAGTANTPLPYQQRLAEAGRFPDPLRVETRCAKTAVVALA